MQILTLQILVSNLWCLAVLSDAVILSSMLNTALPAVADESWEH